MCLFCFSDEPPHGMLPPDDPRSKYYFNSLPEFQVALDKAPCAEPLCCAASCFCYPCAICWMRAAVLDHAADGMKSYTCCQGYAPPGCPGGPYGNHCCSAGWFEQYCFTSTCPHVCLALETLCCPGCSISATRFVMMDKYGLGVSPVDFQIIRLNNTMQMLACVCNILGICFRPCREIAPMAQCLADLVFTATVSCMTAQIHHELKFRNAGGAAGVAVAQAPVVAESAAEATEADPLVAPADETMKR